MPRISAAYGTALFLDDLAEYQHLARSEEIGRRPVKRAPIDSQSQIAFPLGREAADRGAVERQVVPALDQEFLVVVEHVQAALEVAEAQRHSLDALLVGQILQPLFLQLVTIDAVLALLFRLDVQIFQLAIRMRQKVAKFVRHEAPSKLE